MKTINNDFYDGLGEKWLKEFNHPIALLRAENRLRNPWIISCLKPGSKVVDLGCGAGFLAQALAHAGHEVTGVDLSQDSLKIAAKSDPEGRIKYIHADATNLFLSPHSFDAVCAMDLLEHVSSPEKIIEQAAQLLKPGGLFFFHTFNRSFLSWLLVIKGVEWCVKNTPRNMHVYHLFIRPHELKKWCELRGLFIEQIKGVGLRWNWPIWKMVFTRKVPDNLEFKFKPSLRMGYSGYARLRNHIL